MRQNAKPTLITSTDLLEKIERNMDPHLAFANVPSNETEANIVYNRCGTMQTHPTRNHE